METAAWNLNTREHIGNLTLCVMLLNNLSVIYQNNGNYKSAYLVSQRHL